jgi:hypothetical protein
MTNSNRGYKYPRLICKRCEQEFASNQWFRHGAGRCRPSELVMARTELDNLVSLANALCNEVRLHAPNIISLSPEFVGLAAELDKIAAAKG